MTRIGQQAPPAGGYRIGIFEGHIATMARDLAAMQAAGDKRAVFQLTYLTFSREVLAGVRADRFEDPAWAIDMCCRFVEVYLEQKARWERRDPTQCGAWRHAFAASESGHASVLEAMLLGMNAHINYDLAFVTLGACRYAGDLARLERTSVLRGSQAGVPVVRYRDFLRINAIAWESLPRLQDAVLSAFHPVFYLGNLLARRLTMAMGQRILVYAREASWFQTALLLHARDEGESAAVERLIDANATAIAGLLEVLSLRPMRVWRAVQGWRARGGTIDRATTETILAMAARDPAIAELAMRQLAEVGAALVPTVRAWGEAARISDAAALAARIARHAPAREGTALTAYLRGRDARREQVLEQLVQRRGPTLPLDRRWPIARVRRRWRRREALDRAGLADATLPAGSLLRAALAHDARMVRAWRTALGDTRAMRPAALGDARARLDRLARHDDRWVRLTAHRHGAETGTLPSLDPHMTSLIDRVLFLKETQAFLEVDPAVLVHVAERMREEALPVGTRLVTQGAPAEGIRFLMEGEVEVRQARAAGHAVVARLTRPAAIGELSTLNATAATADVVAVTPVRALLLPSDVLLELLTQHPRLAIGLLRTLSDRLIETTRRLESAGS
jgi:hypothetical protein